MGAKIPLSSAANHKPAFAGAVMLTADNGDRSENYRQPPIRYLFATTATVHNLHLTFVFSAFRPIYFITIPIVMQL